MPKFLYLIAREKMNRRQGESNQTCLNCRGAKEEKTAKQD